MVSYPEFGERTTGTEVAQSFSAQIRDKTVLITGVSPNSLGESVALIISFHAPALLVLASRTQSNLEAVASKIRTANPDVKTKLIHLDLSDQISVRHAASKILEDIAIPKIDVLINNAAATYPKRNIVKSPEGKEIELQFATNHVGPFLFTNLLMPKLLKAVIGGGRTPGATRIINISSAGHILSPIRFSDYNFDVPKGGDIPVEERPVSRPWFKIKGGGGGYQGFISYGQSKTANILFSISLNEKLATRGLLSLAVHPGAIWTNLPRNNSAEANEAMKKVSDFWKSHDQGAAPILVAAFDPTLTASSGFYMSDCQMAEAADHASDPKIAGKLWRLSEDLVGQKFDFGIKSQL